MQPEERKKESGVTLIEIMIVLAIIALIMGFLVGPKVIAYFKQAKAKTAWMETKDYLQAYQKWYDDNGDTAECPDKIEDLAKYTNKKDTKDPWGTPFVMKCGDQAPAEAGDAHFGVISLGPDKKEGTGDDLHSWDDKVKTQ
jgi:prepilin-type N-terminal cleavage/methylation domain-containing protein